MSEFVYLYRNGPDQQRTPAEMQAQMERWRVWMKELTTKAHLKAAGHPLEKTGKLVSNTKSVTDGPFAEKDLVGGYSIVEAQDLAHAAELSKGCPVFEFGGSVEVRPIMKFDM